MSFFKNFQLQEIENIQKENNWKFEKIKLFYIGKHNDCYVALFNNKKILIKIRKLFQSNLDYEIEFENHKNIIFFNNYIFIRYWIEGSNYKNENDILLFKEIENFWQENHKKEIEYFDYFNIKIEDKKYYDIVNKYLKDKNTWIICHNDLRNKNIIFSPINQKINLIDFEWCRKNDKYFDLASLVLYCNINFSKIQKHFLIDKKKLKDFIYVVSIYNKNWENTNYKCKKSTFFNK